MCLTTQVPSETYTTFIVEFIRKFEVEDSQQLPVTFYDYYDPGKIHDYCAPTYYYDHTMDTIWSCYFILLKNACFNSARVCMFVKLGMVLNSFPCLLTGKTVTKYYLPETSAPLPPVPTATGRTEPPGSHRYRELVCIS